MSQVKGNVHTYYTYYTYYTKRGTIGGDAEMAGVEGGH